MKFVPKILPTMILLSLTAPVLAGVGKRIKTQCSIPSLGFQQETLEIARHHHDENQRARENRKSNVAGSSDLERARTQIEHLRFQSKVEKIRQAGLTCIMQVLRDELGSQANFSSLSKTPKGQAALREIRDILKEDQALIESLPDHMKDCLSHKGERSLENCQISQHQERVFPQIRTEILTELTTIWTTSEPRLNRKTLAQYSKESLSEVSESLKMIDNQLASSQIPVLPKTSSSGSGVQ